MNWVYDGDGCWEVESGAEYVAYPFSWRIKVMECGNFSVYESDFDLTDCQELFESLTEAKEFCEDHESIMLNTPGWRWNNQTNVKGENA